MLYLLVSAALLVTTVAVTPQTRSLAITRVSVVDVINGRIVPNSIVTIRGETIASVAQNGALPADAQVVDGQGKFLIPGLWDMHAHIQGNDKTWLPLYIANGVTGIRDMGADLDFILDIRDATSSGRMLGPRIVAAGPILDDAPGDWPLRIRVRTADEGRAAVQLLKRRGVDFIKVHNFTPRDVFFAIVDEARRQQLPVAGHVPLKVTIQEGIDAGMVTIEHMSEDGRVWKACSGGAQYRPDACRPFFEMLGRRRVWQTPTLVASSELAVIGTPASAISRDQLAYANKTFLEMHAGNQSFFLKRPEIVGILKNLADVAKVVTRDMAAAGVDILAGCDAMIAGFCVHDELAAMVAGGMKPAAALQTATVNPARYLGREMTLGAIAAGRSADLVLLDANPLEDITNVRRIRAVITAGRFLDRRALDRLLTQAKTAAQQ
ncbi:MAG TPA: amidohydrolase family protein [Vicinamibacterales bacterium]|nr:amidohydrolase family protein [Vicinamibacterales bacterium]